MKRPAAAIKRGGASTEDLDDQRPTNMLDDEEDEDRARRGGDDEDAGREEGPQKEELLADPNAKKKRAPSKPREPRPKLTLELLKEDRGFTNVFNTFPTTFREHFKGKGHEVNDLRRLLEMYSRWQQRIFPTTTFDDFIHKLELMSSNYILKNELRELRSNLLSTLNGTAKQQGAWGDDGPASPAGADDDIMPLAEAQGLMGSGRAGASDRAAPAGRPAPTAVPAPASMADYGDDFADEEELMRMQEEQAVDEQWEMAMENGMDDGPSAPPPQRPAAPSAGAPPPRSMPETTGPPPGATAAGSGRRQDVPPAAAPNGGAPGPSSRHTTPCGAAVASGGASTRTLAEALEAEELLEDAEDQTAPAPSQPLGGSSAGTGGGASQAARSRRARAVVLDSDEEDG